VRYAAVARSRSCGPSDVHFGAVLTMPRGFAPAATFRSGWKHPAMVEAQCPRAPASHHWWPLTRASARAGGGIESDPLCNFGCAGEAGALGPSGPRRLQPEQLLGAAPVWAFGSMRTASVALRRRKRARCPRAWLGKTSMSGQSPWEQRAHDRGNTGVAQRTPWWRKTLRLGEGRKVAQQCVDADWSNDERVRTAVNRGNSGDAARLPRRRTLRRVRRYRESPRDASASLRRKRGEPHGRLQGAINLQGAMRMKPSKPGGTARAEHVRAGQARTQLVSASSVVDAAYLCRRRGDL